MEPLYPHPENISAFISSKKLAVSMIKSSQQHCQEDYIRKHITTDGQHSVRTGKQAGCFKGLTQQFPSMCHRLLIGSEKKCSIVSKLEKH